jgi:iron complex outermembrane receptor protein
MGMYRFLFFVLVVCGSVAFGQTTSLKGKVLEKSSKDPVFNALVEASPSSRALTDVDGNFSLSLATFPSEISVSAFGYEPQKITVKGPTQKLEIVLVPNAVVLDDAEIVASKISEKQKQSPITVEALDIISIKEAAAPSFYEALGNMKGVDLTSASIGFKVINTRGFNSTSPVRSLQVIDGVDNQAPGLNFSLGNFLGASELDVQNVEIVSGAAGALYGPSAFNGVIAIETRNPYLTQGTTFQIKVGERALREVAFRWAEAYSREDGSPSWAVKINVYGLKVNDWEATNMNPTEGSRSAFGNPGGYDAVNRYGDEIAYDNGGDIKTYAGIGTYHRRGIEEEYLVDYGTENVKVATALHYTSPRGIEGIYSMNFGTGTTIYQGDNRFSLKDILFVQNRFEIRKKDQWFIRAYSTHEDAGKTYDAYFTALKMQDSVLHEGFWANQYRSFWNIFQKSKVKALSGYPSESLPNEEFSAQMAQLWAAYPEAFAEFHQSNRNWMDGAYDPDSALIPGSAAFEALKQKIVTTPFHEGGSMFFDRSSLRHIQAQRNVDLGTLGTLYVGGNFRGYTPNSRGTLFSDTGGVRLQVREVGAFLGHGKEVGSFIWNASVRADKNQNFDWLFSPAVSLVYKPNDRTVWRAGLTSAIRNPTLQDQYLYYNVGRALLLGNLHGYDSLVTIDNVSDFLAASPQDRSTWVWEYYSIAGVRPEQVRSVEIGYRDTWWDRVYIDATYYYSWYQDFIGYHVALKIDDNPGGSAADRLRSAQAYRIASNAQEMVTTQGLSAGANYYFKRYTLSGNYSWNVLNSGADDPIIPAYNTPAHKYNVSLAGRDLPWKWKNGQFGFLISHKWVQGFLFEGSPQFTGSIPSYRLTDAQLSWNADEGDLSVKLGASNVFNRQVVQVYGGPSVGRLIYLSTAVEL